MDRKDKNLKNEEIEAFKDSIRKTAEDLVFINFPKRIIQLDKMLVSGKLTRKLSSVDQALNIPVPEEPVCSTNDSGSSAKKRKYGECPAHPESLVGTKVLVLPNGVVPSNKFIIELIDEIKPLIQELVEDANMVSVLSIKPQS